MADYTVVYDACLFYPAPLRDLMIRLAQMRRFRARWTETIQREWLIALLRDRPELDEAKLSRMMAPIDHNAQPGRSGLSDQRLRTFDRAVIAARSQ